MTPEHHALLMIMAGGGRLGPFCPWPIPEDKPKLREAWVTPKTTRVGKEVDLPDLGPRPRLADPLFVAKNWTLLGDRIARMTAMLPPCPHCGSDDISRGATGLDQCRSCDGLFRDGTPLGEYARRHQN